MPGKGGPQTQVAFLSSAAFWPSKFEWLLWSKYQSISKYIKIICGRDEINLYAYKHIYICRCICICICICKYKHTYYHTLLIDLFICHRLWTFPWPGMPHGLYAFSVQEISLMSGSLSMSQWMVRRSSDHLCPLAI